MKVKEAVLEYRRYTCAEIESWDTDERFELIDGVIYVMASPSRAHQKISGSLFYQLYNFLKGKTCEVYSAPFAVYLDKNDTLVQPDIVVVCDKSKLTDSGCDGAPDLIVEILSPSTSRHDKVTKLNRYLQAGVREYWIVDTEAKTVMVHILENEKYIAHAYDHTSTIPVNVLEGCEIIAGDVFAE